MRPRHKRFGLNLLPSASFLPASVSMWLTMAPTVLAGRARRGANLLAGSLELVPLAGSTPLKGRQAEFYKYQTGRRRTCRSRGTATLHLHRSPYSPVKGDMVPPGAPRQRSPEPLVLARFWLLLPRGKSNRRVRGRVAPGPPTRSEAGAAPQGPLT